jgi:hypothetical protein
MKNLDTWSPKWLARIGALLSIGSGFPDGYSISALKKVFVRDNAAATAANIHQFESMLRCGVVAELFAIVIFAISLVLLYFLFKSASRRGAIIFLVIAIMGATLQSLDVLGDVAALTFLTSKTGAAALTLVESQAMAYMFLKMHLLVYTVSLTFTGMASLCLAYLATRSTFIPRFGGYFLALDGLGYITHSVGTLIAPTLIVHIQPWVPYATAILGTGTLLLWLIIKGVNVERWNEQNNASLSLR